MIIYYKRVFKNLPLQVVGANFFLLLLGCIVISTSSCNKSSVIGLDVQPNNALNVSVSDTTTLITKTVLTGTIQTDEIVIQTITLDDALIGTYRDPVFGKTIASLFTQLRLNTYSPPLGTNPQIDSVVLSLVYDASCYGTKLSTQQKQNINVHAITVGLYATSTYHSNDSLSVSSTDLASNFQFTPDPYNSVKVNGTTLPAQLRVRLSTNFGQDLLDTLKSFADSTSFQNYLHGLYVTTQNTTGLNSGEGNIFRFKMDDPQTKLTLYYHNHNTPPDTSSFDLTFNTVARFSNFKHDYSAIDAGLAAQLSNTPPVQNDVVFLQPMAGTRVKIEMPHLMNWVKGGKISINQAELVIKLTSSSSYPLTHFLIPPNLMVYGINDDGSVYYIPDTYIGTYYYKGAYVPQTDEYTFNITRYIQQVLDGKLHNNGLYLTIANELINPGRIVVGGGGNGSSYQMKLTITSTKLP